MHKKPHIKDYLMKLLNVYGFKIAKICIFLAQFMREIFFLSRDKSLKSKALIILSVKFLKEREKQVGVVQNGDIPSRNQSLGPRGLNNKTTNNAQSRPQLSSVKRITHFPSQT
jgi:hypothetical protein